uniref:Uncharacterized protein n=1 Tax=viral metagenome TaxID=1070528 RepID=A0A6C0ETK7_9ZZZZ
MRILYYIIGPVTETDISLIEHYQDDAKYTDIVVVLQGGLDTTPNMPWSSSLMGCIPANAGMNPGKKFFPDGGRGWYDLLNDTKFKELDKVNIICQTTNSAKPGEGDDPRKTWKDIYKDDSDGKNYFDKFPAIKNLIKMYDEFTGAPWQHDPIAVIHSIILLFPNFFSDKTIKTFFDNAEQQEINFTKSVDGIISINHEFNIENPNTFLNTTKQKIYVVPYKETTDMKNNFQKRKERLFELLNYLVPSVNTGENDFEKNKFEKNKFEKNDFVKIICSLEIYDPDNLLALKCIESLAKRLNIPLDIIVHYQVYPTNIKFAKDVSIIYNYNEPESFDKNFIINNIRNIDNYNEIQNSIMNGFNGNIFTFKPSIGKSYFPGMLMYSQSRNEYKESNTYEKAELEFVKSLVTMTPSNPKITVSIGSIYGGKHGYTITAKNLLHPISMISKKQLSTIKTDMKVIIKNCLNTTIKEKKRVENVKSWYKNKDIDKLEIDENEFLNMAVKKPSPTSLFHWNVLDPGCCNKDSVEHYYTKVINENDDDYYRTTNPTRMSKIAELLLIKLKEGALVHLQEYSLSQHNILKEKIIKGNCKSITEPVVDITSENINDYMHYVYSPKFAIPGVIPPIFIDQGLLIASFYKFDKKDKLTLPDYKPVIYAQIGNNVYATTHYLADPGERQRYNHELIVSQISKIIGSFNIIFSCDMNNIVDETPASPDLVLKNEKEIPLFEKNINLTNIGYSDKALALTPYNFESLNINLIQQTDTTDLTSKAITVTMRNKADKTPLPQSTDFSLYRFTAPGKKIDGIYSNLDLSNVNVLKKTNDEAELFLSDHFPLELTLPDKPKKNVRWSNQTGVKGNQPVGKQTQPGVKQTQTVVKQTQTVVNGRGSSFGGFKKTLKIKKYKSKK